MSRRRVSTRVIPSSVLAVAALAPVGCRQKDAPPAADRPAASASQAPEAGVPPADAAPVAVRSASNVLLIMIDSLRADMPWAGYERDIAPRIDAFRRESCVAYTKAYSLSSYTAKSVAPALAGEYPSAMPRDGWFFTRYPDRENDLVHERARRAGHRTLAAHAHGYFVPTFGMNQGFDDYRLIRSGVDLKAVESVTSEALTELVKEQLSDPANVKQEGGRRFFLYVHYMDPHHTYEPHKEKSFGTRNSRDLYDGEVHYTDSWVGRLLDFAKQQPWWKDTAVVITSDHGESFGERNHYRHGFELWESVVRVPLLICMPGLAPRLVTDVRRSHIDLAPTVSELMKLAPEPKFRGKSLLAEVEGREPALPRRVLVDLPRADLMDRRRAVIDGDWKLLSFGDDSRQLLFNLQSDPLEAQDLAEREPETFARMKGVFTEEWAKVPLVEISPGAPLKGAPAGRRW